MKIAYLISAHKDPIHLKRLVSALNDGTADVQFFIHIDKKINIIPFQTLCNGKNIHYTEKRIWTQWGGYSQVLYQQTLLQTAFDFECVNYHFDRFVILTGLDYPLMSNDKLKKIYSDSSIPFMIGINITRLFTDKRKDRFILYHFFRDLPVRNKKVKEIFSFSARQVMKILPFRKKNYIEINGVHWDIYHSSAMAALPRDAAQLILYYLNSDRNLVCYFKTTFCPDELVIPTIVFNSPALKSYVEELTAEQYKLIDVSVLEQFDYGSCVRDFTEKDYRNLVNCGKPFARKLETGISDKLMDMLDRVR